MSELAHKTILLVEDEAIIALTTKIALENYGYAVKIVTCGEKAVEAIKDSPEFDLILMDINLGPGIDGTRAAEIILKERDIPILFVSSHSERDIVEKTERITSYGYVVKSSSITVLDASIKMAFKLFDANEKLKVANNKLETTLDAIPDLMFIVDKDGYFKDYHADHVSVKTAMDVEKIIGSHLSDIFPPQEVDAQLALYRTCIDTGVIQKYSYNLIIQGTRQHFNLQLARLDESHVLATVHDITEQKRTELELQAQNENSLRAKELLRQSQTSLLQAEKAARIGNWTLQLDTMTIIASKGADAVYGMDFRNVPLMLVQQIPLPEYRAALDKALNDLITQNLPYDLEFKIRRPNDGRIADIHSVATFDKKTNTVFGVIQDITDQKQTERALKDSLERLNFALEASGLGEWELNLKTNRIQRNERWAGMLGYSLSEIDDSYEGGIELQHPDDREAVRKAIRNYDEGCAERFKIAYRMRTKDGSYKWIEDCGKIMERDGQGKPLRICGTHADIDEQKKAAGLVEKERKRLQNVLMGTKAGTWEWNIQTGDVVIDEASAALLGYTWNEIRPTDMDTWMSLKHPDDLKEAKELLMKHVRGEIDFYSFESRMKHKRGDFVWLQGRGKIIEWDEDGKPLRMFGTHIDITERKLVDTKIKSLLAEKELILKEVHHRIKNNMSIIVSLISLQAQKLSDPEAVAALKDTRSRVKSLTLLYEKLYQSGDFTKVSLKAYVPALAKEIIGNFPNSQIVRLRINIDEADLDAKRLQPLGIIVNELITNIMKYAFTGRDSGQITVSAINSDGTIALTVQDDGNGIPDSVTFENTTGFGLQLVHALTQQLDGTIRIERGNGTKIILEFRN